MILGLRVYVNSIYDMLKKYVAMLKRAIRRDPTTRAILMAPARQTNDWFKELEDDDDFKFVGYYVKGANVFNGAGKKNAYDVTSRHSFSQGAPEFITVWEMKRGAVNYPVRTYRELAR